MCIPPYLYFYTLIRYHIIMKEKILITGAAGQLGKVLTESLLKKYGLDSVIASLQNSHVISKSWMPRIKQG